MANTRVSTPPAPVTGIPLTIAKIAVVVLLIGGVLLGLPAWLIPVEVVQSWVLAQTEGDAYRKFEAVGRTEAVWWLIRLLGPVLGVVAFVLWQNLVGVALFFSQVYSGLLQATRLSAHSAASRPWQTKLFRCLCLVWAVLIAGHYGHATMDALTSWPYFRFKSGREVLPNISDSNRAVIRYLMHATEPHSRIFVASDQKLHFLSYYLLPRRLYYKSHPESEFVIPLADQARFMPAYRLSEINSPMIEQIAPDYVLEYFEQPAFIEPFRLQEDSTWIQFIRQTNFDLTLQTTNLVCLRRYEKGPRE